MEELSDIVKSWRSKHGMTLREFGKKVGMPISTLSKIENNKLSLTYDKLTQMASALGVSITEFLSINGGEKKDGTPVVARRSVSSEETTVFIDTERYKYKFLCTDLLQRDMVPIRVRVKKHSPEEFGELVKHPGEEFTYVLRGAILLLTEYYAPVRLEAGDSAYIDSMMAHGYISVSDDDAELVHVCTVVHDDLRETAISVGDMNRRHEDKNLAAQPDEHRPRKMRVKRASKVPSTNDEEVI